LAREREWVMEGRSVSGRSGGGGMGDARNGGDGTEARKNETKRVII